MTFLTLHSSKLRNGEHVRFCTEFISVVELYDPAKLKITDLFEAFRSEHSKEIKAYQKVKKSANTENIENSDSNRDFTFRGLSDEVKSKCRHFELPVREAAKRVWVDFEKYGNIARKGYDAATTDIQNLIDDLKANYVADMALIGITSWVEQLDTDNKAFIALETDRYSETEKKTHMVMRQTRVVVDGAYRKILKRINALIEINGETGYVEFIEAINVRIKHFNDLIEQRHGRNDDDNTTDNPNEPTSSPAS